MGEREREKTRVCERAIQPGVSEKSGWPPLPRVPYSPNREDVGGGERAIRFLSPSLHSESSQGRSAERASAERVTNFSSSSSRPRV